MKNLKLCSFPSFDLDLQSEEETLLLSAFDIERNRLFFASSANLIYAFELPSSQAWNKSLLLPPFSPVTLDPGDFITAMDYLMEKEALVLGTSDGCLILHTMDDSTTELVGRVEGGVKCIACSPDGALLTITSGIGQLLVMTQDWEVLHESALNPKFVGFLCGAKASQAAGMSAHKRRPLGGLKHLLGTTHSGAGAYGPALSACTPTIKRALLKFQRDRRVDAGLSVLWHQLRHLLPERSAPNFGVRSRKLGA